MSDYLADMIHHIAEGKEKPWHVKTEARWAAMVKHIQREYTMYLYKNTENNQRQ